MIKNFFLLFSALILCMGEAVAGNVLTVSNVNVPKGGQATIDIGCEFDTDYTAFELQLSLPEGLSLLSDDDGKPIVRRGFEGNHVISGNLLPSNGNYKFTGYSTDENALSLPSDGSLLQVTVVADASLAIGTSLTCTVTGSEFTRTSDSNGENLDDVSFSVNIVDSRIVLDENSTTSPEAASDVDVRVLRSIKANEWSTLVLPFDMTEEQVYEAFGDDVHLAEYIDHDMNDEATELLVTFDDANLAEDGLMANTPYIIKTSKDITEFTVDGVTIDPDEEGAITEYTNGRSGSRKVVYGTFKGIYRAQSVVPNNCLFLSDSKFWYSTGLTTMKAFRAYFDFADVLASARAASAHVLMNLDFTADGMQSVMQPKQSVDGTYNLQGQRIEHPRKGIYIRNGMKVIVK